MRRLLCTAVLVLTPAIVTAQGRNFDGANDNLLSANDALPSLNNDQKSCAFWVRVDAVGVPFISFLTADGAGTNRLILQANAPGTSGWRFSPNQDWSTTDGIWRTDDITLALHHIAITYDRSGAAPGNDPVFYVDGASVTVTETSTPAGTVNTGDDTLKMGESASGGSDFDGVLQNVVCQVGSLWDAAAVNRARWWGRPHGGMLFYYPFYTDKLTDSMGSGGATLTATGSTMTELTTPAVRPGSALLGLGVGW